MSQRIAILGAGVMGETLLSAIVSAGHPVGDLVISEKREERAAELREAYGVAVTGNAEAAADADVILLVVKPQDVAGLLDEIAGHVRPGATVVSLAAGIRIAAMIYQYQFLPLRLKAWPMHGMKGNDLCIGR